MPWYRDGTVAITTGQTTVTGAGTNFSASARVGDAFQGPDGRWYEVTNIASAAVLSILPAYQGATIAAGAYGLAPMQGYVKDSADALRGFVNLYGAKIAALGTTGNYDTLPLSKGGTGVAATSGAGVFAALGAAGILGEAPYFLGNIDTRSAVPLDTCFIGPSTGGTKPAGVSYGILTTKAGVGNQGTHQELFEVTGGDGTTTNTWHRDQYGSGAWGPWRRRYSNNNIVGTVSQAAGTPTGAIIEYGSNANGDYTKYACGTLICRKRVGSSQITTASGALFLSAVVAGGLYPATFIALPAIAATACVSGYAWAVWAANANEPTVSGWGGYYAVAGASIAQGAFINLTAIGRWY